MKRLFRALAGTIPLVVAGVSLAPVYIYLHPETFVDQVHSGWSTPGLRASADLPGDMLFHLLMTTGRSEYIVLLGLVLTGIVGAVAVHLRWRFVSDGLTLVSAVPPLVWVPLSLIYFGLRPAAFDLPAALFLATMLTPGLVAAMGSPPRSAEIGLHLSGLGARAIWWRLYFPWIVYRLTPQIRLSIALIFGVCTVVEYLSGVYGVGAVLKLITGYAEFGQIALLTLGSVMAITCIQLAVGLFLGRLSAAL